MAATAEKRLVLLAVDRSHKAEQAFDWYVSTIHKPENRLLLVHVPEGPTLEMSKRMRISEGEIQKLMQIEKKENEEMTAKYCSKLSQVKLQGEYRVVYGKPGEAIVDTAETEKASMIVIGTRGMGTIRRTILGSVSDYVVHHSHVPVIVCRQ